MPMPSMRTRNVVVGLERLTYADGNGFLADVKMRKTRHERASVEVVDVLFEEPDHDHTPIHVQPLLRFGVRFGFGLIYCRAHFDTPDIRSSTLKIIAKSRSASPMARAAVRNSLAIEVVGRGTST